MSDFFLGPPRPVKGPPLARRHEAPVTRAVMLLLLRDPSVILLLLSDPSVVLLLCHNTSTVLGR